MKIDAQKIFDEIRKVGFVEFRETFHTDIYYVGDQIEVHDETDSCSVLCIPLGNGFGQYYTTNGRVFESTIHIEKIDTHNRHKILDYCLGKYDKDEIVNWTDLFLQGEFIKEIKLG